MEDTDMTIKEYNDLWNKLSTNIAANLRFAELVSHEEPKNSRYFWGEYSNSILRWIAVSVYSGHKMDDIIPQIMTQYYLFVSNPFIDYKHHYYQLTSYKGLKDLKLESWLKRNSKQYFVKLEKKSARENIETADMLEFVDYEALLSLNSKEKDIDDADCSRSDCLSASWNLLSDKDKDVIHLLVIQKLHWEDAYDELNHYINPKGGRQVMEGWTNKRKQDALANLKARAIEHLIIKYNKVKKHQI